MLSLLVKFRQIDRRIVSALVLITLGLPLLVRMPLPVAVFPSTIALKAHIDRMPQDKLVLIACDWDASQKGECDPLTTAMIDYLMRHDRPFALFGFIPQGPVLGQAIAEDLARKHGKKYGEAWVNFGYRPNYTTTLIAIMNDLPGTLKTDINNTPLSRFPILRGVRTLKDLGLLYEVTGTGLLDVYLQFAAGVPLAQGCTAVVGPQQYPYLQSGQIKGLLVGLGGAAQFETLTEFKDADGHAGGQAMKRMGSQSLGHLLVMLLIVLGNLGVWATARQQAAAAAAGSATEGQPS